ncbi:MAG: cation transporter [Spirochaetes bacterium]|jgi:Co/Zn/Cd efflux system component|nr:cation transporter [Spirochaetota bacterium]
MSALAIPGHEHTFGQQHKKRGENRTWIVIALTGTMMMGEIIAGVVFGSMALLTDGLHMASHAVALAINALAYVYARRHAGDARFTFCTGAILLAGFALVMAAPTTIITTTTRIAAATATTISAPPG